MKCVLAFEKNCNHLPPRRSKPVKAYSVFRTQFWIFWMKTGRLATVPLTAKLLTLSTVCNGICRGIWKDNTAIIRNK